MQSKKHCQSCVKFVCVHTNCINVYFSLDINMHVIWSESWSTISVVRERRRKLLTVRYWTFKHSHAQINKILKQLRGILNSVYIFSEGRDPLYTVELTRVGRKFRWVISTVICWSPSYLHHTVIIHERVIYAWLWIFYMNSSLDGPSSNLKQQILFYLTRIHNYYILLFSLYFMSIYIYLILV